MLGFQQVRPSCIIRHGHGKWSSKLHITHHDPEASLPKGPEAPLTFDGQKSMELVGPWGVMLLDCGELESGHVLTDRTTPRSGSARESRPQLGSWVSFRVFIHWPFCPCPSTVPPHIGHRCQKISDPSLMTHGL